MSTSAGSSPTKRELYRLIDHVSLVDARAFRRRLSKARSPRALAAIAADIHAARVALASRASKIPEISYPEHLPVTARRNDIAEAIRDHQVVIIAGETGSGKTTQIPKICLELGYGVWGRIGHTQPRRLAARTVAERLAEELGQSVGESVGYAIRFDDRVSPTTAVKLMTDGILLTEMQRDRYLYGYDTLIIDEAHERSLNIDFLLGYIKQILPKRPDLKVIITSATIDPERFAKHFADANGVPAPIIEVSGRTYPVEIRYRPLQQEVQGKLVDIDPLDGLCLAIEELFAEGPGDILCFFPGERDIRDAMEIIEARKWRGVEVTPLFGRLSNEEQHRVFAPHSGRRIVLATNIAETSLTVPGIHYVVDTGTARISRYSARTKVQRLPIEPISQASANQRSGRCGRIADGIAIRLYSEEDFLSRPEFTDPEILRTNLASVILHMAALKLGDITEFPFVQPPDYRAIRDGLLLLHELGALEENTNAQEITLTDTGQTLSRIPVDPRMARMLIAAHDLGCLDAVTIIVAALTIQDVRERPLDFQAQADQAHARFKVEGSDFLSYVKLWDYIQKTRSELSGNAFRKRINKEFLHYMRIRDWWDLVRQLRGITADLGWSRAEDVATEPNPDAIHQALLSGLLSHIGSRISDSKEFHGARGTKFMVFPGSSLAKKPPQFVMAAELVETSKLWARDVAQIDPAWVEHIAAALLKHQYSEPHWSSSRTAAMAYQKSTLYGVTIIAERRVSYHRIDAAAARDLFIRHALVEGDWNTHHSFFHKNREKLTAAGTLENKARRRDIVVDEDTLFNFYDSRLPENITTGRHFDRWWKRHQKQNPHLLDFDPEALINPEAEAVSEDAFPDVWRQGSLEYELDYRFEPGHEFDGVTLRIPVPLLASVNDTDFEWLVPGLRLELISALIRTLPKALRRSVVPAQEFAKRAIGGLHPYHGSLAEQLSDQLRAIGGSGIQASDFRFDALPNHLRITFAAIDKRGTIIDHDKNLAALRDRQAGKIRASVSQVARSSESDVATQWTNETLGMIQEEIISTVDGQQVVTYPALVATPQGFSIQVLPTKAAADAAMMTATLTMLMREITVNVKNMSNGLPLQQRVALENYPHGGVKGLVEDARVAAIRDAMLEAGGPVRSPEEFKRLKEKVAPNVPRLVRQSVVTIAPALVDYLNLRDELSQWTGESIDDMQQQLDFLLPPHAISIHGIQRLQHLRRYLAAMVVRLENLDLDPDHDADLQDSITAATNYLETKLKKLPTGREKSRAVKDIRWMIEELRVSLFAQRLGTAHPISVRRIEKAVDKLH
ncbi:ATP-dependent RNA helicase HrpA [Corynebacterium freiburgense]|uniref:ATP-dependent RNA helicase HrpA n=1 Tax=Corynebacterium freiburgense TaxID=556548 RepID=UPI00040DC8CF|nr:ATP-dependent RNA helicase HrpA [Corynebacterium freiburgense]WJZ02885.1 ATP-dependent RNA helicase HrpB [Corynebacterium freiburgense]